MTECSKSYDQYPGNIPIYAKSLYTFEKSRTIQLNERWNVHILGFLEFMINSNIWNVIFRLLLFDSKSEIQAQSYS